jgi:predicted regulator of Ras-like GTPase activity (Roadblock/LC7/MglB family)
MNRTVVVTGFAVAALTLLAVQIVNRFGYSSTKGIVILGVIGALALFTVGMNSFAAIVAALAVYYGLDYFLGDKLTTSVLLAAIAVIAALAVQGKSAWRR